MPVPDSKEQVINIIGVDIDIVEDKEVNIDDCPGNSLSASAVDGQTTNACVRRRRRHGTFGPEKIRAIGDNFTDLPHGCWCRVERGLATFKGWWVRKGPKHSRT